MRVHSDSDDDDKPLGAMAAAPKPKANGRTAPNGAGAGKRRRKGTVSDSGDDAPLVKRVKKEQLSSPAQRVRRPAPAPVADDSSGDDDVPLSSQPPGNGAQARANGHNSHIKNEALESDDDDDHPLSQSVKPRKPRVSAPKRKAAPLSDEDDGTLSNSRSAAEFSEATPVKKKAKKAAPAAKRKKKVKSESEPDDEDDDDKPLGKAKKESKPAAPKKARVKKEEEDGATTEASPKKKKRGAKAEEEEEEVYNWWDAEQAQGDGSQKWQTLSHSGVLFPPPYEPLPSTVKMKYNGKPVDLPPESEEVAWFFGSMLGTPHAEDAVFTKNFFTDWLKVLKDFPPRDGTKISSFDACDFKPMFEYFEAERERKKNMSSAEKKEAKRVKDEQEAPFKTCLLDGRKEKVGNFRIEPPGLFRGRGEHPRKGSLKFRVRPEDITINIGKEETIPVPGMPGKWAHIVHDQTVTWLANWKENVNGQFKYVFLAAGSSIKGQSDMNKFEKARELKKYVDAIRRDYEADLKSKIMADRQRATTMYFIDKLALRAGNEKGEEEADTVGCCSLRCEHVTLEPPHFVVFDFLGKDSIRYYNRVEVSPQVFKNIRLFKGDNKGDDDALFDRVSTAGLNKHLQSYMKGLTAKVFRTYNASITFQTQLDEQDLKNATTAEKIAAYNRANRLVAELCNHQRSVPKTHGAAMEKLNEKLRALKYGRMKIRHALLTAHPKVRKTRKELAEPESDIDDDWVATYEDAQRALMVEKAEKKFAKENEKLQEEGKEAQKASVLEKRLDAIHEEYDRLKTEQGTGQAEVPAKKTQEALEGMIEKFDERIKTFKVQMATREDLKEVSLGTSKINYLDPRITVAWCKTHDVPIEKMFNKSLIVKFPWAMGADTDWKF